MSRTSNAYSFRGLFLLLVGTLTFSLSSLPGHDDTKERINSVTLASEVASVVSPCDIGDQLKTGDVATCSTVYNADGIGNLSITRDGKESDFDPLTRKHVEKEGYVISGWARPKCKGEDNCDGIAPVHVTGFVDPKADLTAVVDEAKRQFAVAAARAKDESDRAKAEADAAKKRAEREAACLDKPEEERLDCRMDKLSDIQDAGKANSYYEKYIRADLENKLGSDNVSDQKAGLVLLAQLKKSDASGLLSDQIGDMTEFAKDSLQATQLKGQVRQLNSQLAQYPMGDPRRSMLLTQMQSLNQQANSYKGMADSYFGGRINSVNSTASDPFAQQSPFDPQAMANDLQSFESRLDGFYASILAQQSAMVLPQQQQQFVASSNPRTARSGAEFIQTGVQPQVVNNGSAPTTPWAQQPIAPAAPTAPTQVSTGVPNGTNAQQNWATPRLGMAVGRTSNAR